MEARQFGHYTLLEHMGRGGVASVYRAVDDHNAEVVAVKIFESGPERRPEQSRYLRDREVKMLVSVQHPNIVKFFESGDVEDDAYYAMEFVENSLLELIREGTDIDLADKVHILRQTTSALVAIHRQGIVHRDIKPGNILLDQDPNGAIHVKLTDLGIARSVSEVDVVRDILPARVAGTARYLSPEQIRRSPMDGRSDIFSLGVAAYELLSAARPFQAETSRDYLTANIEQEPAPLVEVAPDLPLFLGRIVEQMLAKDRENRYDSETLARDLELAEQHLISGAPLVETANQASLFYDPTADETITELEPEPEPGLSFRTKALAVAIVLAGLALVALLYPHVSAEPEQGEPVPADPGTPEPALVERVRAAVQAGRHWQALVLLESASDGDLPQQDRDAVARLRAQVHGTLAEPSFRAALSMLEAGRSTEAEILLDQMRAFFPEADQTRRLAAELDAKEEVVAREDRWQKSVAETYKLVSRGQYEQALAVRKQMLTDFADEPERVRAARQAIGDLLEQWGENLVRTSPDAGTVDRFLEVVSREAAICPGRPSARVIGELHMALAESHRSVGNYSLALEAYAAASRVADPDVAQRALAKGEELRLWLSERPLDLANLAGELERMGFGSSVWQVEQAETGGQRPAEGMVRLQASEGAWESAVWVQTSRPIRHRGFLTEVALKASDSMLAKPGKSRAGIELAGVDGDVFQFTFDGTEYATRTRQQSMAAGQSLRQALGDENTAWHEMALRCDASARRLTVLLDGGELQTYSFALGEFRLRFFLDAPVDKEAHVEFRDPRCSSLN